MKNNQLRSVFSELKNEVISAIRGVYEDTESSKKDMLIKSINRAL
ncbi:Zn-dependent M32 family carboxypeptidase [Aquimarina sp. EL_43]|nr:MULTISPECIES: hypothetical protein [unclassified Aquimarina]MBG6129060.1 Zn-dependent M32 family carboxypeptidase [Aquimarina sp. EL_35]MBG6150124.1 Zn-dependent M32 family carboxypeptidase [Aquimarina sp. EL_32]MBG6167190.1 Zn-dependent M32 family carboxypeptidase [Aquimarina sp. EL_43]